MAKFGYELVLIITFLAHGAQAQSLEAGLAFGALFTACGCAPILIICLCTCVCSLIYKLLGKKSAPSNTFIINQALQPSQAPPIFQSHPNQTQHVLQTQLLPNTASSSPNNRVLMQEHPPGYTPNAIHQASVTSIQSWNSHNQLQQRPPNRPLPNLPLPSETTTNTPHAIATSHRSSSAQHPHIEVTSAAGESLPQLSALLLTSNPAYGSRVPLRSTSPNEDTEGYVLSDTCSNHRSIPSPGSDVPQGHLVHEGPANSTPSPMTASQRPNSPQHPHIDVTSPAEQSTSPPPTLSALPLTSNLAYGSRAPPRSTTPDEDAEGYVLSETRSSRRLKRNADKYKTVNNDYMMVIN